ncbi:MAG: hybrid sensor histidine kinase/response regulator [Mastigocladus sp. ERB_26_2]
MLHILIVDDNPTDRLLVKRELEQEIPELQVTEVVDKNEFFDAIANKSFALVVTDYQLRWTNGLEILTAIKSRYPDCPVIMFTNSGNEEIAVAAMKAGLDDYIVKSPRHFVRLRVAVQGALERVAARRQEARLENRLQLLLENLNVGVFSSTLDGYLLESNQAFLNLLGVSNLTEAQAVNLRQLFSQLFPVGTPLLTSTEVSRGKSQKAQEISIPQADGQSKWVLLTQYLNTNDDEGLIDDIVEDITALKQAELALRQLNETLALRVQQRTAELEDVNSQLEAFAYSVSHDLRAPLRAIESFAQILLDSYRTQLDASGQNYLDRIRRTAVLMNTLIENLLDYSRLSRSKLPLEPINLNAVIAEALTQLAEELKNKHARVTVAGTLPTVVAHHDTLLRVLINLLTNAIKFVAPGVQPQVRVWAEEVEEDRLDMGDKEDKGNISTSPTPHTPPSQSIRLWIEDNGIGIPEKYHQQIFGVFERLHGEETYPGTGIGLAIVNKGVERMGGRVGVESSLNQGSRFWIQLSKA